MTKTITVYTKNTCQYCDQMKQYLTAKGHAFKVINVDEEPARQQEAIELSGGMTVPVTVIKDKDNILSVVVGFNLQRLVPALAS